MYAISCREPVRRQFVSVDVLRWSTTPRLRQTMGATGDRPSKTVRHDVDYIGDLHSELSAPAATPIASFTRQTAWACAGGHSQGSFDDVLHRADQQAALIQAANSLSTRRAELAERLLRGPEQLRNQLHRFLTECTEIFFEETWNTLRPMLHQEQTQCARPCRRTAPNMGCCAPAATSPCRKSAAGNHRETAALDPATGPHRAATRPQSERSATLTGQDRTRARASPALPPPTRRTPNPRLSPRGRCGAGRS